MSTALAHQRFEHMFRPAIRENIGIFIGLAGESGSGKTWSAMALAKGIVGPGNRFAVIDTENKRARHYADDFAFDVLDLGAPYSSLRYQESVKAAFDTGYKAIVVDSATHEHDGEGGYLDAQRVELDAMVDRYMKKYPQSKEWEVREKLNPSAWNEPKRLRKRMMYTLLACSSTVPIIFCFRAEEKFFGTKDGKLVAHNPPKWQPVCGKGMPYEMTVSFILHADRPGVPIPIKLPDTLKHLFPSDKPLTEKSGEMIAEWARGGNAQETLKPTRTADRRAEGGELPEQGQTSAGGVRPDQRLLTAPSGSPEDDRAGYIATIESAKPAIVTLKKKQLFGNPNIDHRTMEISSLQTLALAVKG